MVQGLPWVFPYSTIHKEIPNDFYIAVQAPNAISHVISKNPKYCLLCIFGNPSTIKNYQFPKIFVQLLEHGYGLIPPVGKFSRGCTL